MYSVHIVKMTVNVAGDDTPGKRSNRSAKSEKKRSFVVRADARSCRLVDKMTVDHDRCLPTTAQMSFTMQDQRYSDECRAE